MRSSEDSRDSSEDLKEATAGKGEPIFTPGEYLLEAAKEGRLELIPDMLKEPALKKEDLEAAIDAAAVAGHPQVINALKKHIDAEASVDYLLGLNETAPTISNAEFKDLAASIDAQIERAEEKQKNNFFTAIEDGDLEYVEKLIKQNPDLKEAKNSENKSPGILAAEAGHREILERLVPGKEDRERKGDADSPSLEDVLKEVEATKLKQQQEAETAELAKKQSFLDAARNGPKETLDKMLQENPNLATTTDKDGKNALHLAAESGQKEILAELLKNTKASELSQAKDRLGRTPLHYAAENGNKEMCDALIESALKDVGEPDKATRKEQYIAQEDKDGRTAAHLSANNFHNTKKGLAETLKSSLYIADSFALTLEDYAHASQLRLAITAKKTEDIASALAKHHNLINIADKDGKTAFHFAAQYENQEALAQILKYQIKTEDINRQDKDGKTPLIFAAETGNQALYETLVKAGADKEFQHDGKTAEAIFAEAAAKRTEEERLKQEREAATSKKEETIDPELQKKMQAQAPGSNPKGRTIDQEDFFAGHVQKLPYQPGEPCKNGEDKFKFDPQTRTTTRAMSDSTKSHVMETANSDGSFKYEIKTMPGDDSPTKVHKVEGDFGTLYFNAQGAMIGAELSKDLEKLKKLDPAQLVEAQKIEQAKLVREMESRSSGAKSSSLDTAQTEKSQTLGSDGKPVVTETTTTDVKGKPVETDKTADASRNSIINTNTTSTSDPTSPEFPVTMKVHNSLRESLASNGRSSVNGSPNASLPDKPKGQNLSDGIQTI